MRSTAALLILSSLELQRVVCAQASFEKFVAGFFLAENVETEPAPVGLQQLPWRLERRPQGALC